MDTTYKMDNAQHVLIDILTVRFVKKISVLIVKLDTTTTKLINIVIHVPIRVKDVYYAIQSVQDVMKAISYRNQVNVSPVINLSLIVYTATIRILKKSYANIVIHFLSSKKTISCLALLVLSNTLIVRSVQYHNAKSANLDITFKIQSVNYVPISV